MKEDLGLSPHSSSSCYLGRCLALCGFEHRICLVQSMKSVYHKYFLSIHAHKNKLFVNSHGQLPSIFRENECSPLPCAVEFIFLKKHKICFSLLIEIHWILEHRTDKHGTVHLMRECRKPNQKRPDMHGEALYIESGEADGGWSSYGGFSVHSNTSVLKGIGFQ